MATIPAAPAPPRPLRVWPGVVIVALQWLGWFVVPAIDPDAMQAGVMGVLLGSLAVFGWWLFASRAPWSERLAVFVFLIAAMAVASRLVHVSIRTGMMGFMFPVYALPGVCLALVLWAAATRRMARRPRMLALAAGVLLACGIWTLVRTGGFTAALDQDFAWRWAPTHEEILLAADPVVLPPVPPATLPAAPVADQPSPVPSPQAEVADTLPIAPSGTAPITPSAGPPPTTPAAWPGFRGPSRDGAVRGVAIATDWSTTRPVELWRRKVGPGWSSLAVAGDRVYTQEQRGDDEVVASYSLATGQPAWRHRDPARFWESNAGAGPRGTPTLAGGRVYTLGATGIVNALDAGTGAVVWTRNAAADTGATLPTWGFSSSPLVLDDQVIVAASGALVAYEAATGKLRWKGPTSGEGYSSPHLATIGGVPQILQLSSEGLSGITPTDGTLLWKHLWKGYPIVQPALTTEGDVLISVEAQSGTRRLAIAQGAGGWTAQERWTSNGLKPYFNDFVVHEGHAYGFDGSILACIDLVDGKRKWKGGRYGNGQLVLLPDQDVMLVLSEDGELALVSATTGQFTELARMPAIEGKTWNHPVLVGDVLLARNGEEMVAFRLPRK